MHFVAHRGESADAPENTLAAFNLAWERRDQAIELDVHMTKDGEFVCCHDGTTDRTTGVSLTIAESTLAQIKTLNAGHIRGEAWSNVVIPTLAEAFATVPSDGQCFIEIKSGFDCTPNACLAPLSKIIRHSGLRDDQVIIICFDAQTISDVKAELPWITAYLLTVWSEYGNMTSSDSCEALIAAATKCSADGLNVHYQCPLDQSFVNRIKAAGLSIYVWTVDDVEPAQRLINIGVDGITSNRPAWLRAQLGL